MGLLVKWAWMLVGPFRVSVSINSEVMGDLGVCDVT